jgi:hypothetical protein
MLFFECRVQAFRLVESRGNGQEIGNWKLRQSQFEFSLNVLHKSIFRTSVYNVDIKSEQYPD